MQQLSFCQGHQRRRMSFICLHPQSCPQNSMWVFLPDQHIKLLCPAATFLAQGREELEDQAGREGKTKMSMFDEVLL